MVSRLALKPSVKTLIFVLLNLYRFFRTTHPDKIKKGNVVKNSWLFFGK